MSRVNLRAHQGEAEEARALQQCDGVEPDAPTPNAISEPVTRSPKLFWSDTGLALHLAQLDAPTGAHLENIVCTDLLAWREIDTARPAILYWRTSTSDEVDCLIERKGFGGSVGYAVVEGDLRRSRTSMAAMSSCLRRIPSGSSRWI